MNKSFALIVSALAITACVQHEPPKTVYQPQQYLGNMPMIQVSDVVNYTDSEVPVIVAGVYQPSATGIVLPEFENGEIRHVYFDSASSTLTPRGTAEIATSLESPKVKLRGYADPRGSQSDNLQLSKERADAVKQYMEGKGVSVSSVEYFGEDALPEY